MNELKKAFYDVMYKYEKCFSERGVTANLEAWNDNKGPLTNLLRRHPDWDEQELAIVFDLSVSREINLCIGHPSLCVCCGQPSNQRSSIKCNCENLVVCTDCGQTVSASNARYVDGAYYCNACLHICAACHSTVHTDMFPAFNREGHMVEVCADCYQTMVGACASCSVRPVCAMLSGARFCQRTAITSVAA